jgi:hypothetical protein
MNIRFTTLILMYVSIISCSKEESNTWEENRDALIGYWNGEVNFVKTNVNTNRDTTGTRQTKVRFLNEEIITFSHLIHEGFETNIEFNWVYQAEPETIIFSAPDQIWYVGVPLSITIINKDKNSQVWMTEYSDFDYNPITMEYTNYKIKEIWQMTKQ